MSPNDDFKTPGQLLETLLAAHGWSQRVLSVVLGMEETGVNKLVKDKKPVTADIAITLEEVFGVPAETFVALQRNYDLATVAEMIKRGWLNVSGVRDPNIEPELAKFFGVEAVEEIEILPHAAKKTVVSAETTPAQLAWLYRVRQIACEMIVAPYAPSALRCAA